MRVSKDFVWWRDPAKGFRLTERRRAKVQPRALSSLEQMGFFRKDERAPTASEIVVPARIEPGAASLQPYKPLSNKTPMDFYLSQLLRVRDGATLLTFVNEYGPLSMAQGYAGHDAAEWIEFAAHARRVVEAFNSGNAAALKQELDSGYVLKVDALLVAEKARGRLEFGVYSLQDALWLCLAERISGGVSLKQCRHCSDWFRAGPGEKKQSNAQYCSRKCAKQHSNDQRSKER